jgi:energy-coupling factor transport system ATP-binding protein
VIIGPNACGKSTLLRTLSRLVSPLQGEVLLDGVSLRNKEARRALHAQVGVAFQYPEHQLFSRTVASDVAFGPQNAGLDPQEVQLRVREAMQRVGLDYERYAQRNPFELSGGEKRRVALAGVVATRPQVLVLDEPTAGLDPAGRHELLDFIASYHLEGNTVVLVSHNMDDIALLCSDVLVLNEGQVFDQGTPAQVFARADELRAINLGVPQAAAYASELGLRGFELPAGLLTVEALADALAAALGGSHG